MDDLTKRGQQDRSKINMHEPHEVKYWSRQLGVSKERLQQVVDKVGNAAAASARSWLRNRACIGQCSGVDRVDFSVPAAAGRLARLLHNAWIYGGGTRGMREKTIDTSREVGILRLFYQL